MKLANYWNKGLLGFGLIFIGLFWWPDFWMPFHDGKWLIFHLMAVLGVVYLLAGKKSLSIPSVSRSAYICFGLLFAAMGVHLYFTQFSGHQFVLLNRLSFFLMVWVAWKAFTDKTVAWQDFYHPLLFLLAAVSFFGLFQLAQVGFPREVPFQLVGSTFGHTSQTAQAVGILLILALCLDLPKKQNAKILLATVCVISFSYFFLLRSRSTLIGAVLAFLVYIYLKRKEKISWKLILPVFLVAIILFSGLQLWKGRSVGEVLTFQILREKAPITIWRAETWKHTVKMIADHPMGIGTDRFRELFIAYNRHSKVMSENTLTESPHNEFLRYVVEDGFILSFFYLLLLVFLLRAFHKTSTEKQKRFLYPVAMFFFVEMLFQMPWREPFPVYVGALIFGYMLSVSFKEQKNISRYKWFLLPLLLAQLGILTSIFISKLYEKSVDAQKVGLACKILPSNWRACLEASRVYTLTGDLTKGRDFAQLALDRAPMNFLAYRFLSVIASKSGDRLESCFYLWKYDDILMGKSSYNGFLGQRCQKKWLDYFHRKRPNKYYRRDNKGQVINP